MQQVPFPGPPLPFRSSHPLAVASLLCALVAAPAAAQRPATPEDFLGITSCEAGRPVTRFRSDVTDSLLLEQLHAHEEVHRRQAAAFASCEGFLASLVTARMIIDVELPAYCAQWRVAVGQGASPDSTRREFAWRISAQSGAMENRLQIAQRMEHECPLVPGARTEPSLTPTDR